MRQIPAAIAAVMLALALAAPAAAQNAFDKLQEELGSEPSEASEGLRDRIRFTEPAGDTPSQIWCTAENEEIPSVEEFIRCFEAGTAGMDLTQISYWAIEPWASEGREKNLLLNSHLAHSRGQQGLLALQALGIDGRIIGERYGDEGPDGRGVKFIPYLRRPQPMAEAGEKGDKGERGARGARGEKGDTGDAPLSLLGGLQLRAGELESAGDHKVMPEASIGLRWDTGSWFVEGRLATILAGEPWGGGADLIVGRSLFWDRFAAGIGAGTWKRDRRRREVPGNVDYVWVNQNPWAYGLLELQFRLTDYARVTLGGAYGPWEHASPTDIDQYWPVTGWLGVSGIVPLPKF